MHTDSSSYTSASWSSITLKGNARVRDELRPELFMDVIDVHVWLDCLAKGQEKDLVSGMYPFILAR